MVESTPPENATTAPGSDPSRANNVSIFVW
jgi:hypothetical protein